MNRRPTPGKIPTIKTPLHISVATVLLCSGALSPAGVPFDWDRPAGAGDNTVVLWSFDDGDGTAVKDSADPVLDGANTGAITGPGHAWGEGKFGGALELAPVGAEGSFVSAPINEGGELFADNQATLAAWINPSENIPEDGAFILGLGKDQIPLGMLRWHADGSLNAAFRLRPASGGEERWVEVTHGSVKQFAGRWSHVAATVADGVVRLYVDGAAVAENAEYEGNGILGEPSHVFAGRSPGDGGQGNTYYAGLIDDARVLNAALP